MEYKLVIGYVIEVWCFATGRGKEEEICMRRKKEKKKVVGDRQNVTEKKKSKGGEVNFNKITRFEDLKV